MRELCHRCHGELPERAPGSSRGDEDAILFCPRCAAPQIQLPEHMRPDTPVPATTGALPPPRLSGAGAASSFNQIDWHAALASAAVVAGIGMVLVILSLLFAPISILVFLWSLSAAVIALGLYVRLRPQARMDARVGMRVGVTAGLMMLAAMGVGLATTGVVMRFGTHSLEQSDRDVEQQRRLMQQKVLAIFDENIQDKDLQMKYAEQLNSPTFNSPEFRAGGELGGLALDSVIILIISAGFGAFVGKLRGSQAARAGLQRGNQP